jgi:cardiolipin synthase
VFVEEYLVDLRRARFALGAVQLYAGRCFARSKSALWENPQLARSVGVSALAILVGAFAWALVLSFALSARLAHRFLILQAVWLALTMAWVMLHLGLMRGADGRMPRRLGAATVLTLIRLELVPSLITLILARHYVLATIVFLVAGLTDVADGMVARRWKQETRLGTVLDLLVDLCVTVGVFWAATRMNMVSPRILALLLARYLLLLGGAFYIMVFHGPVRIRPTVLGKFSGLIINALTALVLLAPAVVSPSAVAQIRDLSTIAFACLFAANMVQILLIGVVNLRAARRPRVAAVEAVPFDRLSSAS